MSNRTNNLVAFFVAITLAVFAGGLIRVPAEVPFGILAGAVIGVAVANIMEPNRTVAVWLVSLLMVIVTFAVRIANDNFPISPDFYWGMLGLVIGWIQCLAMSWRRN